MPLMDLARDDVEFSANLELNFDDSNHTARLWQQNSIMIYLHYILCTTFQILQQSRVPVPNVAVLSLSRSQQPNCRRRTTIHLLGGPLTDCRSNHTCSNLSIYFGALDIGSAAWLERRSYSDLFAGYWKRRDTRLSLLAIDRQPRDQCHCY